MPTLIEIDIFPVKRHVEIYTGPVLDNFAEYTHADCLDRIPFDDLWSGFTRNLLEQFPDMTVNVERSYLIICCPPDQDLNVVANWSREVIDSFY